MDVRSSALFGELRRRHFPPDRNLIPAHLTLFHKLPGKPIDSITSVVGDLARRQAPIVMEATRLRFLGRGVAIAINSPELVALRQALAARWSEWLTPQDRQPLQPHVTIQNKVTSKEARALYERMSNEFDPFRVEGSGLLLWRYLRGPWMQVGAFPFTAVLQNAGDKP